MKWDALTASIADHAFFKQSQFKGLLRDNLLEIQSFTPQVLDFIGGCSSGSTASEYLLADLQELFHLIIAHSLRDAFLVAQLSNAVLATQSGKCDPDLLLG
jgi:hypothetical protein